MKRFLKIVGLVFGILLVAGGIAVGLWFTLGPAMVLPLGILAAAYAWVLFSFLQYRYGRQEEFQFLLQTVAESEAPLAPALWAYVLDRPHGHQRQAWLATLLFFVLPGYYWIWHRKHSFDFKIARIATRVQHGVALSEALRTTPGVASADTRLAVSIGQSTGQLALCLGSLTRRGLALVWLEIIPRFVYPILLLFFLIGMTSFVGTYILPRFATIFSNFNMRLPEVTLRYMAWADVAEEFLWVPVLVFHGCGLVVSLLLLSSTLRWFCPVVGRIYRMHIQGRALRALAALLQAAQPAPEALSLLLDSGCFRGIAARRLRRCRRLIELGEPLPDSLRRSGLLPRHMLPLVQAAERAQNLPWALTELGDFLADGAVGRMRRLSQLLFPVSVVAIGLLVGFTALAIFSPVVEVMTELSG